MVLVRVLGNANSFTHTRLTAYSLYTVYSIAACNQTSYLETVVTRGLPCMYMFEKLHFSLVDMKLRE